MPLSGVRTYTHLEYQHIGLQANPVSGVRSLSHLEQSASSREAYNGFSHSQVCGHIHTQSTNTLACRQILFQVCGVFHTWNRAHPAERPIPELYCQSQY